MIISNYLKDWLICFNSAYWAIFHAFLSSADFFSKSLNNSFRNTIRVANSLDLDQASLTVESDLDPNCLQR